MILIISCFDDGGWLGGLFHSDNKTNSAQLELSLAKILVSCKQYKPDTGEVNVVEPRQKTLSIC